MGVRNSPTIMANRNLPSEIIFEVLTRVPAKSLLRFRCVCKSWRSLISTDPQFVKKHLHRAISDDVNVGCWRLLQTLVRAYPYLKSIDFEEAQNDGGGASSMMLHFLRTPCDPNFVNGVSVIGSCNGLICLLNGDIDKIIVCNPCTRKFRELPIPSIMAPVAGVAYGFGYDSSADDYKVVIAAARRLKYNSVNDNKTEMEVFSLKHNSWKRVEEGIHSSISFNGGDGAFLDGSLHWIGRCRESQSDRRIMVSFKLATEEFCELVPLPPDQGDWFKLSVLGGCLSVVRYHGDENEKCEIWMKKEYGVEASWTKLLTYLEQPQLNVVPLSLLKNGELLLDVGGEKLIMYDLKKMTARELDVQGPWKVFETVTYIETLVSPNGNQA